MKQESASPFESIESAHDFVTLLSEAVSQTKKDIDADIARQQKNTPTRSLDALRIASYNLDKLETYMKRSGRILNDLRSLRRLLFQERGTAARPPAKTQAATASKPASAGSPRRSDSKTGAVAVL